MIAILGPGSLGLLLASRLGSAEPVMLLGRPGTSSRDWSFRFRDASGEHNWTMPLQGVDQGDLSPCSAVLVTTKAPQTEPAVAALADRLPRNAPILLLQNGMGSQQAVAERFPDRPILAATTTEGAHRPEPDLVVHAGDGHTRVGALTKSAEASVATVVALLQRSQFKAQASDHILTDLWQKLAVNAGINPFTAVLNLPNGQLPEHPYFEQRIGPLCREIEAVAKAEGIELNANVLEDRVRNVCASTAANISSMLQDVRSGRATEIDFINGYLVRRARAHGLSAPLNEALTLDVQALDHS